MVFMMTTFKQKRKTKGLKLYPEHAPKGKYFLLEMSKTRTATGHLKQIYIFTRHSFIPYTVELRFNEVAGDRPYLFVKWRVRYIENLDITNLRKNDQNVRYIEVIVND